MTLENTGTTSLPIAWVGLGGTDPSQFERTRACPASLAAGASCSIDVLFKPISAGPKSAKLIVSTGANGTRHSVALAGTGI